MLQTTEQLKLLDAVRAADIGTIKTNLLAIISDLATQNSSILGLQTRWDANKEGVTNAQRSINTDHDYIHDGKAFTLAGTMVVANAQFGAIELTPHAATFAAVTLDCTAALSDLTFTALAAGVAGNDYSVEITSLLTPSAALAVSFSPITKQLTIHAGCDEAGAINSTAAQVMAAVNASSANTFLVCGAEGVGSGLVNVKARASLTGGTNDSYVHMRATAVVASGGPVTVTLLEDYTITSGGAAATAVNRRRTGTPPASVTAIKVLTDAAKTAGGGALTLDTLFIPSTTQGVQRTSGQLNGADEWVLKPGTHYMLSFANAAASPSTVGYQLFWYEEASV